jgi:hypothetical protein
LNTAAEVAEARPPFSGGTLLQEGGVRFAARQFCFREEMPTMTRITTPLEQFVASYWGSDRDKLLLLLENRFRVHVDPEEIEKAADVTTFVNSLKNQVDHPGRLERVAERLLRS